MDSTFNSNETEKALNVVNLIKARSKKHNYIKRESTIKLATSFTREPTKTIK